MTELVNYAIVAIPFLVIRVHLIRLRPDISSNRLSGLFLLHKTIDKFDILWYIKKVILNTTFMYNISTNNKVQAEKLKTKLEQEIIDLKLQKARIESDIYYYSLLEKDLPLSKTDKLVISQDKKNLSMLRQVINFFSAKVNNIIEDNIESDEKVTTKHTKSKSINRRS